MLYFQLSIYQYYTGYLSERKRKNKKEPFLAENPLEGEASHHPFEVVALLDDVPGEVVLGYKALIVN